MTFFSDRLLEIARRLAAGGAPRALRDLRGVTYALGASETPPSGLDMVTIPSLAAVRTDKRAFSEATSKIHHETNHLNARSILQWHGDRAVIQTPPDLPLPQEELDRIYALPYTRRPHFCFFKQKTAYEMVK